MNEIDSSAPADDDESESAVGMDSDRAMIPREDRRQTTIERRILAAVIIVPLVMWGISGGLFFWLANLDALGSGMAYWVIQLPGQLIAPTLHFIGIAWLALRYPRFNGRYVFALLVLGGLLLVSSVSQLLPMVAINGSIADSWVLLFVGWSLIQWASILGSAMLMARLLGFRLLDQSQSHAPPSGKMSIRDLLILTAVCAGFLGVVRGFTMWAQSLDEEMALNAYELIPVSVSLISSAVSYAGVLYAWVWLSPRSWYIRITAILVLKLAVSVTESVLNSLLFDYVLGMEMIRYLLVNDAYAVLGIIIGTWLLHKLGLRFERISSRRVETDGVVLDGSGHS